jgi:hypothetical protein
MSKVKIQGHASGTGVLTLTSPNTSTDRTITIPDSTGTVLLSDGDGSSLTNVGDLSFGGDTFGADKTIGSNDNYALSLETNATERLKLTNDGRGLSQFTAKAWCNFDGTGSPSTWERDAHNVSSYFDHGTGEYTINWDIDLANADYSVTAMCNNLSYGGMPNIASEASAVTTSSLKVKTFHNNSAGTSDATYVCLQVFGD